MDATISVRYHLERTHLVWITLQKNLSIAKQMLMIFFLRYGQFYIRNLMLVINI